MGGVEYRELLQRARPPQVLVVAGHRGRAAAAEWRPALGSGGLHLCPLSYGHDSLVGLRVPGRLRLARSGRPSPLAIQGLWVIGKGEA